MSDVLLLRADTGSTPVSSIGSLLDIFFNDAEIMQTASSRGCLFFIAYFYGLSLVARVRNQTQLDCIEVLGGGGLLGPLSMGDYDFSLSWMKYFSNLRDIQSPEKIECLYCGKRCSWMEHGHVPLSDGARACCPIVECP